MEIDQVRACPEFSDADYLEGGVLRVLETSASGRAFLQEHGPCLAHPPTPANYFVTLHSAQRQALLAGVNLALLATANRTAVFPPAVPRYAPAPFLPSLRLRFTFPFAEPQTEALS